MTRLPRAFGRCRALRQAMQPRAGVSTGVKSSGPRFSHRPDEGFVGTVRCRCDLIVWLRSNGTLPSRNTPRGFLWDSRPKESPSVRAACLDTPARCFFDPASTIFSSLPFVDAKRGNLSSASSFYMSRSLGGQGTVHDTWLRLPCFIVCFCNCQNGASDRSTEILRERCTMSACLST